MSPALCLTCGLRIFLAMRPFIGDGPMTTEVVGEKREYVLYPGKASLMREVFKDGQGKADP